jgi:hypothetical protein
MWQYMQKLKIKQFRLYASKLNCFERSDRCVLKIITSRRINNQVFQVTIRQIIFYPDLFKIRILLVIAQVTNAVRLRQLDF